MSRRRNKGLSQDDLDVWHHVARGVRPTPSTAKAPGPPPTAPLGQRQASTPRHKPQAGKRDMTHGVAPGLDRRTEIRLRRGTMPVDGRLDLHGLYHDEARDALWAFLSASQARRHKCVLVITGKGRSKDGKTGVLRRAVPGWLNEMGALVHAFHYATPKDGGEGALYVLLRRPERTK